MTNTTSTKRKRRMAREPKAERARLSTETAAKEASAQQAATLRTLRKSSKADKVISLLKREGGATLEAMCEATGWLPHSCRAFLTGLRKKGMEVSRGKDNAGTTIYRLGQTKGEGAAS